MRLNRLTAPLTMLLLVAPAFASDPVSTEMSLTAKDGFVVKGTLTIPGDAKKGQHVKHPVVILAHQYNTDRSGWAPLNEKLWAKGIATLALDLRGHGASTQKGSETLKVGANFMASATAVGFNQIPDDLAMAAAWVRKQPGIDKRKVGLAGSSVGAFSVLMAEPQVKPLAVLSLSAAGAQAFDPNAMDKVKTAVLRGRAAVLLLAADGDKDAADIAKSLAGLPGVTVMIKTGDDHGFAFFKNNADTMAAFFGEYLTYRQVFNQGVATTATGPQKNVINAETVAAKAAADAKK